MRINRLYTLLLALVALLSVASCGEDRTYEYLEKTEENQWTYSKMKEVYYWAGEMKQPERSVFFSATTKFFSSLLSKSDKVSFFTDSVTTGSYGLEFALMRDPLGEKPNRYYAVALYVEPGSPAALAGIGRGTWISGINGKALTSASGNLLLSGEGMEVITSHVDYDDENGKYFWTNGDTLAVQASATFDSKAIYVDSVYNVRSSKVGYVACRNLSGSSFETDIQEIMLGFAAENVTDIVVDLRYCSEGALENANAVASALVPVSLAGTPFATLCDKDGNTGNGYDFTEQPVNLSDKRVFFITGKGTKGAAEVLVASVNASRGMHEVIVVGEKSAGGKMQTARFDSPYGFSINPAVAVICASDGNELPDTGIAPDFLINELEEGKRIYPLGNEQEYILRNIEYYIVNGSLPE